MIFTSNTDTLLDFLVINFIITVVFFQYIVRWKLEGTLEKQNTKTVEAYEQTIRTYEQRIRETEKECGNLVQTALKRERAALARLNRQKLNPIPPHIKDAYISSQINSNIECSICLEKIDSINSSHLTPCGHLFHTECFNQVRMVRRKRRCPTCRT